MFASMCRAVTYIEEFPQLSKTDKVFYWLSLLLTVLRAVSIWRDS